MFGDMGRVAHQVAAALLCAASLLSAGHARADDANAEAAQVVYVQARKAYQRGDYQAAYDLFAQSQKLDPATGTELNLALCAKELGRLTEASRRVDAVLAALPPDDERVPVAQQLRRDLDARIPRVTLRAAGPGPGGDTPEGAAGERGLPAGAAVLLDGAAMPSAQLGRPLPIDPGAHTVVVRSDGHEEHRQSFTIVERDRVTLTLRLGPRKRAPQVVVLPDDDLGVVPQPRQWLGVLGWSLTGVGVASLGVSAVMTGLILDRKGTVEDHCDAARVCDETGFEAAADGRTFNIIGTTTFVVGLLAAGGGLALAIPSTSAHGSTKLTASPLAGGGIVSLTVVR